MSRCGCCGRAAECGGSREDKREQVKDPVCGAMVPCGPATLRMPYRKNEYVFCSTACLTRFMNDPARYV
jgi:YHS domain-containing protein